MKNVLDNTVTTKIIDEKRTSKSFGENLTIKITPHKPNHSVNQNFSDEQKQTPKEIHYSNYFLSKKKQQFYSPGIKIPSTPKKSAYGLSNMMQLNKKISLMTKKNHNKQKITIPEELNEIIRKCQKIDKSDVLCKEERKGSNQTLNTGYDFFEQKTNSNNIKFTEKKKSKSQNSSGTNLSFIQNIDWKRMDFPFIQIKKEDHEVDQDLEKFHKKFSSPRENFQKNNNSSKPPFISNILKKIEKEKEKLKLLQKHNSGLIENEENLNKNICFLQNAQIKTKKNCFFHKNKIIEIVKSPDQKKKKFRRKSSQRLPITNFTYQNSSSNSN